MKWNKENMYMINTRILKIIGFYQISSTYKSKVFNVNIFKLLIILQLLLITICSIVAIINMIYTSNDINNINHFLIIIIAFVLSISKISCIIKNVDRIWNCVKLTSINNLSYKYHSTQILQMGIDRSKYFGMFFIVSWSMATVAWWISPLIAKNHFMYVVTDNQVYHYRYSVFNFVFPVTDKFYNDHYVYYYVAELLISVVWAHGTLIFDAILISMSITFAYQLKAIANSYENFSTIHTFLIEKKTKILENNELQLIYDFKILILDHQHVMENMRNIYKIFRPVLLLQIALHSLQIILCSSLTIMNFFNGLSLVNPSNQKLLTTISMYIIHLFFYCYLFCDVKERKTSIIFAMYSSDWTERSIQYKKLLLLTMRMNNANSLTLHVTRQRIVDLEMFTSIMKTSYSILSVLVNYYLKR